MIVRCSLSSVVSQQKLKKLYLRVLQAHRKDHNWHKTVCFRWNSSFFRIWCTQSSLVQMSNYKKRVKFCILLSPSVTHSLSHFHDIEASPPKVHRSHKKGKISPQPHTVVKQSSKLKGNLLIPSLFSLFRNCIHDEIWGCCAEIMPISNLKSKKERERPLKCWLRRKLPHIPSYVTLRPMLRISLVATS